MSEPKVNERDMEVIAKIRYSDKWDEGEAEDILAAYREEIQAEMSDPAFDIHTTNTLSALRAELDRTIQAVEDALQGAGDEVIRELNADGCFSWPIITRKRIKELRAEVERLKGELDEWKSMENERTLELQSACADLKRVEGELAAERARERYVPVQSLERLRSLPDRMWADFFRAGLRRFGDDDWTRNVCAGVRWARRWLRRDMERG